MKNIHLIPTDNKLSRLYFNINDKEYQICEIEKPSTILKPNRHIYITSNEEIKEGDWFITTDSNEIHKSDWIKFRFNNGKKIILTTDQDLIKDGVQAIDDEFLEWFVKNPSCEEVEVIYDSFERTLCSVWEYEIIIPKEEPKQETLEEVAEKYAEIYRCPATNNNEYCRHDIISAINFGAKWQQEQDKNKYSDEEVLILLHERDVHNMYFPSTFNKGWKTPKEWFNKFKKK